MKITHKILYDCLFQPHNLLNKIKTSTSEKEQEELIKISQEDSLHATLLPIKTVGVQVNLDKSRRFTTRHTLAH